MCRHSIADQLEMGDPTVLLHSWLRRLRSALAPGESQRHHPRRGCFRAATRGLNVEVLEDRALPSLHYAGSFPVGNLPQAVVTADFNNDGHLDLATANYYDGDVSVLLGDERGAFGAANDLVAGTNPVSLAVGDFNNDGHLDLATANKGSNDLSMLLGNGDGTFRATVQIPTLAGPKAVASADFNADCQLDLVYLAGAGSLAASADASPFLATLLVSPRASPCRACSTTHPRCWNTAMTSHPRSPWPPCVPAPRASWGW